jgi:hypothetical protein
MVSAAAAPAASAPLPIRAGSAAIAARDVRYRHHNGAQRPLAPPCRRGSADERRCQSEKQAARSPGGQHRNDANEHRRQHDPSRQRIFVGNGDHWRLSVARLAKIPGEHERNCAYSITKTFPDAALQRMN